VREEWFMGQLCDCDILKKCLCSPGIICCLACDVEQFGKQKRKTGGFFGSNFLPGNSNLS